MIQPPDNSTAMVTSFVIFQCAAENCRGRLNVSATQKTMRPRVLEDVLRVLASELGWYCKPTPSGGTTPYCPEHVQHQMTIEEVIGADEKPDVP